MRPSEQTTTWQPLTPNPGQARFINNTTSRECGIHVFVGGAGAGKSQGLCQPAQECAVSLPSNEICIARKFARDLRRTTWREFISTVPRAWVLDERKIDMEILMRSSDERAPSRITFIGLDDSARLGSTQFGQVFVDEANEIGLDDFITLRQRLRHRLQPFVDPSQSPFAFNDARKRWQMTRFIALACNPIPNPDHWLRQLYVSGMVAGRRMDRTMVRVSTYDNRENLPEEYIQTLEEQPEAERRRMLLGEDTPGIIGDACTPSFNHERHIFRGALPSGRISVVRGWDFGWRHAAVLWATVLDKSAVYVWRENFSSKMTLRETVQEYVLLTQGEFDEDCDYTDHVDHMALHQRTDKTEDTCSSILRDLGFRPRSAYSRPRERAELIDDLLRTGRLYVHASCEKTIAALDGYWHREKESDEPEKDGYYDHIGDALGYLVWGVFGSKGRKLARDVDAAFRDPADEAYQPRYTGKDSPVRQGFNTPAMRLGRSA